MNRAKRAAPERPDSFVKEIMMWETGFEPERPRDSIFQ